jgi:hypothetical protein
VARSAGEIEIIITGNPRRLVATTLKASKQVGEEGGALIEEGLNDVDFRELRRKLLQLRQQAQRAMAGIEADIGFSDSRVRADLRRIQEEIRSTEVELFLTPELESARLIRETENLRAVMEDILEVDAEAGVSLNMAEVREAAEQAEAVFGNIQAEVEFQFDRAEIERLRREVGFIGPIDLDVDAGQARAKIEELQRELDADVAFEIQLDEASAAQTRGAITALRQSAEAIELGINLDEDDLADIQAELETLRTGITVELEVEVERASLREAQLELKRATRGIEADLGIHVDPDDVADVFAEVEAMREALERQTIDLGLEIDTSEARGLFAQVEAIQRTIGDLAVNLDVHIDPADLLAAEEEAERIIGEVDVPVDTHVEPRDLAQTKSTLDTFFSNLGKSSGEKLQTSLGLSFRLKAIIAGIATLTGPASVLLFGGLADAIALTSSAVEGLVGGLGAATPLFAGLVGSVGAGVIAFSNLKGVFKAIGGELNNTVELTKEEQDKLEKLGPEAEKAARRALAGFDPLSKEILAATEDLGANTREFALSLAEVAPQFQAIKEAIGEAVFRGLADEIRLLSVETIPDLGESLEVLGGSFRTLLIEIGDAAKDIDFTGLAEGIAPALDDLARSTGNLVRTFARFLEGASGPARELADRIEFATGKFEAFIDRVTASGELEEFLSDGLDSLDRWLDLLGSVGTALFDLFRAGSDTGDDFVTSLTHIVDKFDDWIKSVEGQDALADFFQTGKQIARDLLPVLRGLQGLFKELITDQTVDSFGALTQSLEDILPFIGQLFEIIGRANILTTFADLIELVGDTIQPIIPQLDALADALGAGLQGGLEAIAPVLPPLAEAFGRLAEALAQPIADSLSNIGHAFANVLDFLTPFVDLIAEIPEPLLEVFTAFVLINKALGPLGPVLKVAVSGFQSLFGAFQTGGLAGLVGAINPVTAAIAGVSAAIAIGITAFGDYAEEQRKLEARAKEVADALERQFDALVEGESKIDPLTVGLDALGTALTEGGDEAKKLTDSMGTLGIDASELDDIFVGLKGSQEDQIDTLTRLGQEMGLTSIEADALAKIIANDDDLREVADGWQGLQQQLNRMDFSSGQDIEVTARAMEELQDQIENVDFDKVAKQFFNSKVSQDITGVNEGLLQTAEAQTGLNRTGEDLLPLYKEFTRLLALSEEGMLTALPPADGLAEALGSVGASLETANAAAEDVGPDWDIMAQALRDITEESLRLNDPLFQAVEQFTEMSEAAQETKDASDALKASWDLLFGSGLNLSEATDAVSKGFNDIKQRFTDFKQQGIDAAEALKKGQKAEEQFTLALEGDSKSALENRALIRSRIDEIINQGAAMVRAGSTAEETSTKLLEQRQTLINLVEGFDLAGKSAEDFINELGLTPENIITTINAPGLTEAKEDFDELLTNIENLPPEAITKILTPGQIEALENSEAYADILNNQIPDTVTTLLTTPGIQDAITNAASFSLVVQEAEGVKTTTIQVNGVDEAIDKVQELNEHINTLLDTATGDVLFGIAALNIPTHAHGGRVGSSGGIVSEFGQPELVQLGNTSFITDVPTFVPPGSQVTPITGNAAAGRVVNQQITVNTLVDDPIIVAEQVMNRTAEALAL